MRAIDLKSSGIAGLAGAILLIVVVQMFDYIEKQQPPLYNAVPLTVWALLGFIVGFSVQTAERLTGAS